jgi:hypothetical protein
MCAVNIHDREKFFYEEHARLSLINLFPERFSNKMIIDDKPDLQDKINNIGVEVTRAMFDDAGEANGFFEKIKGTCINDLDPRKVNNFEKLGNKPLFLNDKIEGYFAPASWVSDKELIRAFESKLKAVNKGNFTCFESNGLYIFSPRLNYMI